MVRFACLYNALIYLGAGCFSVYYMVAYHDVGLSVLLISIVNVVFDVSESASELPTSVLFDRWSRERMLIIGVLCRVAGFILMLFWSANFAVLCLANVLAGIGAAVESGAASSLYIEYTRKHDPSLGMKTLVSRLSAMIGVCTICGGAVGAVLFLLDSQLIWLGATVFYVLAIIPLLGLMRAGSRTKAAATDGSGTTEGRGVRRIRWIRRAGRVRDLADGVGSCQADRGGRGRAAAEAGDMEYGGVQSGYVVGADVLAAAADGPPDRGLVAVRRPSVH